MKLVELANKAILLLKEAGDKGFLNQLGSWIKKVGKG